MVSAGANRQSCIGQGINFSRGEIRTVSGLGRFCEIRMMVLRVTP
jgi:hypothetical protein